MKYGCEIQTQFKKNKEKNLFYNDPWNWLDWLIKDILLKRKIKILIYHILRTNRVFDGFAYFIKIKEAYYMNFIFKHIDPLCD